MSDEMDDIVEEIYQSLKDAGITANGIKEVADRLKVRAFAVRDQSGSDREGPIAAKLPTPGKGDATLTSTGMSTTKKEAPKE